MIRNLAIAVFSAILAGLCSGATLERLTLDEMAAKSTAVVMGQVLDQTPLINGTVIYTQFRFEIKETWKGQGRAEASVAVPGGETTTLRQTFSGTPKFNPGQDYLLFLWSGRSGITQVIGLAQGVFEVKADAQGRLWAIRSPISETLLDPATGEPVEDRGLRLPLEEVKAITAKAGKPGN